MFFQDTDELMMAFSYKWQKHPVLYDTAKRIRVQTKGNAAMCLALQHAKEQMSDALGLDGMFMTTK